MYFLVYKLTCYILRLAASSTKLTAKDARLTILSDQSVGNYSLFAAGTINPHTSSSFLNS
jgi:hypothetical protein